jgi:hypothetical protein
MKFLSSRPAAISRTTVTAISMVSRVLRSAVRDRLPPAVRAEMRKVSKTALPVEEIAGNRPASKAARRTRPLENSRTVPSM